MQRYAAPKKGKPSNFIQSGHGTVYQLVWCRIDKWVDSSPVILSVEYQEAPGTIPIYMPRDELGKKRQGV